MSPALKSVVSSFLFAFVCILQYSLVCSLIPSNPATNTINNRILGLILSFNLDHMDAVVMSVNEYVSMCESGWTPTIIIFTTVKWSNSMVRYLKMKAFCYRLQDSIKFRFSNHNESVGDELAKFHRQVVFNEIKNFDVFIYHEDDMIFKHSQLIAYLSETLKLNSVVPDQQVFDFQIGFLRYRRILRTGEIHHAAWNDVEMISQEVLEEEPSLTPICMGGSPYLIVDGDLTQSAWILTQTQVIALQAKCSFLNQSSPSRAYMGSLSIFEKKEGHCGVSKLIPAGGISAFALYHYYGVADNREHTTSVFTVDQRVRVGNAFSGLAGNKSFIAVQSTPSCWVEYLRSSRAEQAMVLAVAPTMAPVPTPLPSQPPTIQEGDLVRSSRGRQVYIVKGGLLRAIPNLETFQKMGLDFGSVHAINEKEISSMKYGEAIPIGG